MRSQTEVSELLKVSCPMTCAENIKKQDTSLKVFNHIPNNMPSMFLFHYQIPFQVSEPVNLYQWGHPEGQGGEMVQWIRAFLVQAWRWPPSFLPPHGSNKHTLQTPWFIFTVLLPGFSDGLRCGVRGRGQAGMAFRDLALATGRWFGVISDM